MNKTILASRNYQESLIKFRDTISNEFSQTTGYANKVLINKNKLYFKLESE